MVLHSVKGLLSYSSGALKASDNTYLAKSTNLNNCFVATVNIALNAIGIKEGFYYSKKNTLYRDSSPQIAYGMIESDGGVSYHIRYYSESSKDWISVSGTTAKINDNFFEKGNTKRLDALNVKLYDLIIYDLIY
ncbi:hypothetical protein [Aliarcobacter butzleri]|uniref:hypothetical protein n=1 Tax=Aliarcobacter butzleri TaxID=28197 RepID=UPI002B250A57|nr:hypothetical protein [Aliarcobacter butzleri]